MDEKHVLIIGGGAAGLVAAIAAARNGARVTVLEKMDRVGKKILATGNGRCNFTNINMDLKFFHGNNVKFAQGILEDFNLEQCINFFEYLGIAHKVEEEGRVFPRSDQASSLLNVLRYELNKLGIREECNRQVVAIHKKGDKFHLHLKNGQIIKGDRVVVAIGGRAAPQLGSMGEGHKLAEKLGHRITKVFPALVQLKLEADFLRRIQGVKFKGLASLALDNRILRQERGEILFTNYGISGPPILQLSRGAAEELLKGNKPQLLLDIYPDFTRDELLDLINIRRAYQPQKNLEFSFVGLINNRLIPVILKEAGIEDSNIKSAQVSNKELANIVDILKEWTLTISGTQSWQNAQTTGGGVDVDQIDSKSLQSKLVKGLYFAGEVVDIDGDCGGYNLQWAWSSGYVAGEEAAKD